MLNSYVNGLKLVLKSVNHLVFDGKGFKYEDVQNENVVDVLKRYGSEYIPSQTNNSLRGVETLEYYIFDVYFTDESKPYLDKLMSDLKDSINCCGYGIVNSINSYNNAIENGLNRFELEINNICDYFYGEVANVFNKVDKVYLPKEGVTYNIVAMSSDSNIWREDGNNCEDYCNVLYSEILSTSTLSSNSKIDNFVVLNGYTLLQNCAKNKFVGVLDDEKEITFAYFKAMLFACIVNGAFVVE